MAAKKGATRIVCVVWMSRKRAESKEGVVGRHGCISDKRTGQLLRKEEEVKEREIGREPKGGVERGEF